MTFSTLLGYALRFAIIFPAIILHEISHGIAAVLTYLTTDNRRRTKNNSPELLIAHRRARVPKAGACTTRSTRTARPRAGGT